MKVFTKKRVIWSIVILSVVGIIFMFTRGKKNNNGIQTDTVKKQDVQLTVLATGQVTSGTDLKLSFLGTGIVKQITVKEGDTVVPGQVLATLDQSTARANLLTAQGTLAQAKANYDKVVQGAKNEQIDVAQKAVDASTQSLSDAQKNYDAVKLQQDTSVSNSLRTLLNGSLEAIQVVGPFSGAGVSASNAPVISGLYMSDKQGAYTITQSGNVFSVSGIENAAAHQIDTRSTYALGTSGLYIQFPTDNVSATWQVKVPNDQGALYVTNYNAYQTALAARSVALTTAMAQMSTAESSLHSAEANLAQLRSSATSAEIGAAKAQILSAEGQVAAANVVLNNTILRAPAAGTITKVDVKVGEQASSLQEVMVLQDVNNLYAEANVSEANIALLKVGQNVDYTFDALSPDRHFVGTVSTINPASTLISGVVNYKVTAKFNDVTDIKPGMTTNMTIMIEKKSGVLAIPTTAIIKRDGKEYARVIDDPKKKTFHEVSISTGLEGDGGIVEVTSGLNEGESIVTYMK